MLGTPTAAEVTGSPVSFDDVVDRARAELDGQKAVELDARSLGTSNPRLA